MPLAAAKTALRRDARARRRQLHRVHAAHAPAAALQRLRGAPELVRAVAPGACVAGYWPVGTEFDVRPLLADLHRRGVDCALPVTPDGAGALGFRRWRPGCAMAVGRRGIAEPAAAGALQPDVLLVPLLAVDVAGRRLGYGGGYYDMTLAQLRARRPVLAIGVAYAGQLIDAVPAGDRDEPLDWLVTEAAAHRFGRPAPAEARPLRPAP